MADDEGPVRVAVVEMMAGLRDGLGAAVAADGRLALVAAVASLRAAEPVEMSRADAVLVQAASPGLDLILEVRLARELAPGALVVVVSGYVDDRLVDQLADCGASWVTSTHLPLTDLFTLVVAGGGAGGHGAEEVRRAAAAAAMRSGLSPREHEVLTLLSAGVPPQRIAHDLRVAVGTVRDHLKQARAKLGCENAVDLVIAAHRLGALPAVARPLR